MGEKNTHKTLLYSLVEIDSNLSPDTQLGKLFISVPQERHVHLSMEGFSSNGADLLSGFPLFFLFLLSIFFKIAM